MNHIQQHCKEVLTFLDKFDDNTQLVNIPQQLLCFYIPTKDIGYKSWIKLRMRDNASNIEHYIEFNWGSIVEYDKTIGFLKERIFKDMNNTALKCNCNGAHLDEHIIPVSPSLVPQVSPISLSNEYNCFLKKVDLPTVKPTTNHRDTWHTPPSYPEYKYPTDYTNNGGGYGVALFVLIVLGLLGILGAAISSVPNYTTPIKPYYNNGYTHSTEGANP